MGSHQELDSSDILRRRAESAGSRVGGSSEAARAAAMNIRLSRQPMKEAVSESVKTSVSASLRASFSAMPPSADTSTPSASKRVSRNHADYSDVTVGSGGTNIIHDKEPNGPLTAATHNLSDTKPELTDSPSHTAGLDAIPSPHDDLGEADLLERLGNMSNFSRRGHRRMGIVVRRGGRSTSSLSGSKQQSVEEQSVERSNQASKQYSIEEVDTTDQVSGGSPRGRSATIAGDCTHSQSPSPMRASLPVHVNTTPRTASPGAHIRPSYVPSCSSTPSSPTQTHNNQPRQAQNSATAKLHQHGQSARIINFLHVD